MEKAVGVICEFNPFHNGHQYFFEQVKKQFPNKRIVCVMSGNFVQRGSFAIQEKYSRAKSAILGGADLVLELPFPFSSLSAESFASSAVSILQKIGVVDTLAFGCEREEASSLFAVSENLSSERFRAAFLSFVNENKNFGYPAARSKVYADLFGETKLLDSPNAILALEYLLAIREQKAELSPFVVLRNGDTLREDTAASERCSATAVRKMIADGTDFSPFVPEATASLIEEDRKTGRFPVSMEHYATTIFYLLRSRPKKELSAVYGLAPIFDRAVKAASTSESIEELIERVGNRNFTHSRIRRALLSLLCGIGRYAEKETPTYTLVLASNEKGRELLSEMKESSAISVFTKPAHALKSEDGAVYRQASRAFFADDLYAAAFPKKGGDGEFLKKTPHIL